MTSDHINVRIPRDLRDDIDSRRPATCSREEWVRQALRLALEDPQDRIGKLVGRPKAKR